MTPTPTSATVADVYRAIAEHLTTGLGHATIYPTGIRVDLSGHHAGTVQGVDVAVTLTIPAGIIPARSVA